MKSSEHLRETVKVEKFELPVAALPDVSERGTRDDSKTSGTRAVVRESEAASERAGKVVAAAMWILAAAIVAALWFTTS